MIVTQITDCKDANALGRTESRISSLLQCPVNSVGVNDLLDGIGTVEAAGNLIEVLDAIEDREAIVIVNAAPRQGEGKKWENGTPFAWFQYKNTKVISSIQGNALSLVKKLKLVDYVNLIDIPHVLPFVIEKNLITIEIAERIRNTQFRSFDYLPRVAYWLSQNIQLPSTEYSLTNVEDIGNRVWWIDNFGNTKTTLLASELDINEGKVQTKFGLLPYYNRMKDVPNGETALITGSSGIESKRFVELIVQGEPFAKKYGVKVGDNL